MKLFSQIGHGDAGKTLAGLAAGLIDGAILSPRNCSPDDIVEKIDTITRTSPQAEVLLDPQFYATFSSSTEGARIGKLMDWPYFTAVRKSDLENPEGVETILQRTIEHIHRYAVTSIITPNIYISRSFDSREGVIAKNFVRAARSISEVVGIDRRIFATLSISREALLQRTEFEEFLNDVTRYSTPPDGFYILIGGRGAEAKTDIFHADVIASWLLLNYSLRINGFDVINGYSDILSPFLGAVGAYAGATGWHSNLRTYSQNMFDPPSRGGRPAIKRYLSSRLLNRITFVELDALRPIVPSIANNLFYDSAYDPEPELQVEMLQSWEALRDITRRLVLGDVESSLTASLAAIARAEAIYAEIAEAGIALDKKSNDDHIEPLREGIEKFKLMAGLSS